MDGGREVNPAGLQKLLVNMSFLKR